MKRGTTNRFAMLAAAVAAAAVATTARAQVTVVDSFDDGHLRTNGVGAGTGFSRSHNTGGLMYGVEVGGAFRVDVTAGRDDAARGISSKDGFDFWNGTGATVQWTTGNVAVTADNDPTQTRAEWIGGEHAAWRQQLGVVSYGRNNQDENTSPALDEFYTVTGTGQAGLYINLFYTRDTVDPTKTYVTGNVQAANQAKAIGDVIGSAGRSDFGTFSFTTYGGQGALGTTLFVDQTHFSLSFSEAVTFTPSGGATVVGGSLQANFADFTAPFTTEFDRAGGPDAFVWAMGQNNTKGGRGRGDVTAVSFTGATLSPETTALWNVASGNWATAGNWSLATPGTPADAVIANGGTATVNSATAAVPAVSVGFTNGSGAVVVETGGTLTTEAVNNTGRITVGDLGAGTLTVNGGTVTAAGPINVGQVADGTVTVNDGAVTANIVNIGVAGHGSVVQKGGTITTTGTSNAFVVGQGLGGTLPGTGEYTLEAGTLTVAGQLRVGEQAGASGLAKQSGGEVTAGTSNIGHAGSGRYELSGGKLRVNGAFHVGNSLGSDGVVKVTAGELSLGNIFRLGYTGAGRLEMDGGQVTGVTNGWVIGASNTGTGAVVQTDGSVSAGAYLQMGLNGGKATYEMKGGTLGVGTYLILGYTYHAASNTTPVASFTQTGGTVNVTTYLNVGHQGEGTFELKNGTTNVTTNVELGAAAAATYQGKGRFIQSGGTFSAGGTLLLGTRVSGSVGSTGHLTISGGSFNVNGNATVGSAFGTGIFEVIGSDATQIRLGGNLTATAVATAPAGPQFRFYVDADGITRTTVVGTANISGAQITLGGAEGYVPMPGFAYDLLGATSITSGTLAAESAPLWSLSVIPEGAGQVLRAVYRPDTLVGDANFDGVVDGADYQRLIDGFFGNLAGWENGDFNRDGAINADDFVFYDRAVLLGGVAGTTLISPPAAAFVAVPEPGALSLAVVLGAGVLAARRRVR